MVFFKRFFEIKRICNQVVKLHLSLQRVFESIIESFADMKEFRYFRKAVLASPFSFMKGNQSESLAHQNKSLEKCLNLDNFNFSLLLASLLLSSSSSDSGVSNVSKHPDSHAMEQTKQVVAHH